MLIKSLYYIILSLVISNLSHSQFLPSLALAGGPIAGWDFNNTDVLNAELKKAGFPELSTTGFFTTGGGGFIDIPLRKENRFMRFGGMGIGFSSNKDLKVNDSLTKAVTYSYGFGAATFDFVRSFGIIDLTFGFMLGTGTLKLDLYQYGNDYGSTGTIFGEFANDSSSQNITRNFKVRFYSVEPRIGFGLLLQKFIYLKLDAGYLVSINGKWKVDNDIEAEDFPEGVKSNGFNINLGLNFGIFFRD